MKSLIKELESRLLCISNVTTCKRYEIIVSEKQCHINVDIHSVKEPSINNLVLNIAITTQSYAHF